MGRALGVILLPRWFWATGVHLAALALLLFSSDAFAQSTIGAPTNAAVGRSLTDAVSQNEKELIDREVLGSAPPGRATSGTGAGGISVFSTGRIRGSDHDGLTPPATDHFSYETREASAFANIVTTVPGTVLGGQVKLSGFVGQNKISLDLKSNGLAILEPTQSGSGRNDSVIAGATALWALKNTYALATIIGTWGETTLKDSVDDCYGTGLGYAHDFCHHNRYSFKTSGVIGTVTAGHVFDLAGASGPKLDLRGSISYTHNVGDRFTNVFGDQQKYTFSTWNGTGGVTLFSNMTVGNNGLLRPYIMGYVRQEWGYRNEFDFLLTDGTSGTVREGQKHLYGGVDAGLTYTQDNTTFGAAIYYEASGDERTLGGRVGISQKLDGVAAAAQKSKGFTWTGFYVGANAGGTWAESRTGTAVGCLDFDASRTFDCTFRSALEEPPASTNNSALINAAGTGELSDRGVSVGGQAGYNLQKGGLVFGLEVDAGSFNLGASRSVTVPALATTVVTSFDTNWLFTARTRLGVPLAPNLLLYGTTGVALTDLGVGNSVTSIGSASNHGLVTGWTIGAGAEWALGRNWTLRAEYLHLDFGKVTVNTPTSPPSATDFNTVATTADLTAQILRAGVNYRF